MQETKIVRQKTENDELRTGQTSMKKKPTLISDNDAFFPDLTLSSDVVEVRKNNLYEFTFNFYL